MREKRVYNEKREAFASLFLVGAEGVEPPTTLYHLTCCFLDPNIIQTNAIFKRRSQIMNTAKIYRRFDLCQIFINFF